MWFECAKSCWLPTEAARIWFGCVEEDLPFPGAETEVLGMEVVAGEAPLVLPGCWRWRAAVRTLFELLNLDVSPAPLLLKLDVLSELVCGWREVILGFEWPG